MFITYKIRKNIVFKQNINRGYNKNKNLYRIYKFIIKNNKLNNKIIIKNNSHKIKINKFNLKSILNKNMELNYKVLLKTKNSVYKKLKMKKKMQEKVQPIYIYKHKIIIVRINYIKKVIYLIQIPNNLHQKKNKIQNQEQKLLTLLVKMTIHLI